jgi:hypothetical protein
MKYTGPGRPPKPADEVLSSTIRALVSDQVFATIKEVTVRKNMASLSDYIRLAVYEQLIKDYPSLIGELKYDPTFRGIREQTAK